MLDIDDYQQELEKLINEAVTSCDTPNHWEEDYITLTILREFMKTLGPSASLAGRHRLKISWSAYRQRKKSWGDLGLLVNIKYNDGLNLHGGAVLEAKKRSRGSVNFDAVKAVQLSAVETNAPHSMLLLYDYEKITGMAFEPLLGDLPRPFRPATSTPFSHSVVCPINVAKASKWNTTSLYRFGLPFSYQLCYRYFNGLDLEFGPEQLNILQGGSQQASPTYLVIFSVAHGNLEPDVDRVPNPDLYSPLGEEK